jgi:hypothetical protein
MDVGTVQSVIFFLGSPKFCGTSPTPVFWRLVVEDWACLACSCVACSWLEMGRKSYSVSNR